MLQMLVFTGKLLVATAASVEKWHPRQWRGRYRPLQLVPPWDSRIAGVVVPKVCFKVFYGEDPDPVIFGLPDPKQVVKHR